MKTSSRATLKLDGFALVASLSLMILLTIVAVGLLGLSAISLRGANQGQARAEAQANARLALMMAIGELQKQVGPDQRITANGAIRDEVNPTTGQTTNPAKNPHWTGVWDSWIAGPKTSAQLGTYPSQDSHHQTLGNQPDDSMRPAYAEKNKHFRSWLLSLNPAESTNPDTARSLALNGLRMPGPTDAAIELVGQGSLGPNAPATENVSARLLKVSQSATGSSGRGRFAWWVGDESQKARVMDDSHESNADKSIAGMVSRQQSPGSMGTRTIRGLEGMTNDSQLASMPSLATLNLLDGVVGRPSENYHSVTPLSHHVLADVREGGLKRDLSVLLERPISANETNDKFMLYKFSNKDQWMTGDDNQEAVPIQDLAAYYQLYDGNRNGWKQGVRYSSNLLNNGLQINSPDYGERNNDVFQREYTNLYRQPVPIKVQFLLSLFARPIQQNPPSNSNNPNIDTHELLLGFTPSITLWNPTNLPLTMRFDPNNPDFNAIAMRFGTLPLRIRISKNNGAYAGNWMSLPDLRGTVDANKPELFNLYFSGKRSIVFEPGEVKIFSLPFEGDLSGKKASSGFSNTGSAAGQAANLTNFWFKTDKYFEPHEVVGGWEPRAFMLFNRSASGNDPLHVANGRLKFKSTDRIRVEVDALNTQMGNGDTNTGGALYMHLIQSNYADQRTAAWERRHYVMASRQGSAAAGGPLNSFNQTLISKGFSNGTIIRSADKTGNNIISPSSAREGRPFLQFSLIAGVEAHENSHGGISGGRRFASRPFLHSSPLAAPFFDDHSANSLYTAGWSWTINDINEIYEAPVQPNPDNILQGFYGGGDTAEFGSSNIVQQEIPTAPLISIAALSHARLGGYSIADEPNVIAQQNQVVTATGQAGLFPHTVQAIGNSYAHPLLPPDKAHIKTQRTFNQSQGQRDVTFADHSYLANKALWDDFFFSSITPQPSSVKTFDGNNRTLKKVANDFFFNDKPLPNRRIIALKNSINEDALDKLVAQSAAFDDGLADQIAAHLMVAGPFNINSTSVEAWKTLLTSLKGKPVAYLDKSRALNGGLDPEQSTIDNTPVASFSLPNGKPSKSSEDPQTPEQWYSWRELTDDEIEELADAIVRQVKLRGPFLSLSEFVNRRLVSGNPMLATKGALQSALDDSNVSINEGFRNNTRMLGNETSTMSPAFPEALEGPVAYGSSAYVDQADILRNFASTLTPRGDTFVIRAYGDSLDASGKVMARAWCEAVVQRFPEYTEAADLPHVKQSSLTSNTNRIFGRNLEVMKFRWLSADEV